MARYFIEAKIGRDLWVPIGAFVAAFVAHDAGFDDLDEANKAKGDIKNWFRHHATTPKVPLRVVRL